MNERVRASNTVAASDRLGTELTLAPIIAVGAAVLALLAALWAVTFVKTVRGGAGGALLRPR